jgi:hypothetical protein
MDFGDGSIEIRYRTDDWGPYDFDFANALPAGESIATASIQAYYGNMKTKSDISTFTSCATLIELGTLATGNHTHVQVRFQHPGTDPGDSGKKCTLRINVSTESGGKYPFLFYPVNIVGNL